MGGVDGRDVVLRAETTGLTIAISDPSVVETNAGTTTITFIVTLSAPGNQTIAVSWATANGTATTADGDYVGTSGMVGFAVGDTSEQVTITVNGDTKFELNETFVVNLSNAVGATIGDNQGVGTIVNDNAPPTVTLALSGSPLAEDGGVATVTATLSAVSGQTVTVDLGFTGTATHPTDYARSGTSIVIPAGSTTGSITLTGVDDPTDEVDETIIVDIIGVTNGTEAGTQQVTATITDDDVPTRVWTGLAVNDDRWSVAANWQGGIVPVNGEHVRIASTAESAQVIFDTSVSGSGITLASLTRDGVNPVDEPFHITGDTLTLNGSGPFAVSAAFTQSGGTIAGTGLLTVTGLTSLSGGEMVGAGTTIAEGGLNISRNGISLDTGRTLENRGGRQLDGRQHQPQPQPTPAAPPPASSSTRPPAPSTPTPT